MTTERQSKANKINALKSTGPTLARGKVRSAGNAKKHGLTTAPERTAVLRWYQIILNDAITYPDPFARKERMRVAHALAEAEARLERTCTVEQAHLQKLLHFIDPRRDQKSNLVLDNWLLDDPEALEAALKEETDPRMRWALQFFLLDHPNRPAALHRKSKVLARYRREAEAQRRRALGRWIAVLEHQPRGKIPKQSQLQP